MADTQRELQRWWDEGVAENKRVAAELAEKERQEAAAAAEEEERVRQIGEAEARRKRRERGPRPMLVRSAEGRIVFGYSVEPDGDEPIRLELARHAVDSEQGLVALADGVDAVFREPIDIVIVRNWTELHILSEKAAKKLEKTAKTPPWKL